MKVQPLLRFEKKKYLSMWFFVLIRVYYLTFHFMVLVATDRQGQNPRAEHVHRDRKSAWNIKTLLCCCCLIAIISETRKPGKVFSLFFASYPVTLTLCTKEKKKKNKNTGNSRERTKAVVFANLQQRRLLQEAFRGRSPKDNNSEARCGPSARGSLLSSAARGGRSEAKTSRGGGGGSP